MGQVVNCCKPANRLSIGLSEEAFHGKVGKLRSLSQLASLAFFAILLFRTDSAARLLLETDPLVAVGNAVATRALYRGLVWSLAVLIPTLFLGRIFCGWICPLRPEPHLSPRPLFRASHCPPGF